MSERNEKLELLGALASESMVNASPESDEIEKLLVAAHEEIDEKLADEQRRLWKGNDSRNVKFFSDPNSKANDDENDERLQLLGALLVKSVNQAESLPEPLRGLVSAANEAMTGAHADAPYKLFDESGISGFTVGLHGEDVKEMEAVLRLLADDD